MLHDMAFVSYIIKREVGEKRKSCPDLKLQAQAANASKYLVE